MSKYIDNADGGSPAAPEPPPTMTLYLAQAFWREPGATQDVAKTFRCTSPDELREAIAGVRLLRGAMDGFTVTAWEQTIRKTDGHWHEYDKRDLRTR